MADLTRRRFAASALAATATGFAGLRRAAAQPAIRGLRKPGFGPLLPDPNGVLNLPGGFTYQRFSATGETMADGLLVPAMHDGMGAFPGADGLTLLVRNHETESADPRIGAFGDQNQKLSTIDPAKLYDPGYNQRPITSGTTTLVYDTREQRLVSHHLSLAGTFRNCAGGVTPWGSWITCEETEFRADRDTFTRDHGYNFEVPASATPGLVDPVPLKAMGRFNHEAVAVDPRTGIVYQTEDKHAGLITRLIPYAPGDLAQGGRLQALCIPIAGRDPRPGFDTRNWPIGLAEQAQTGNAGGVLPQDVEGMPDEIAWRQGQTLPVRWMDLTDELDIESPDNTLRYQAWARGAARFARGEGMWHDGREVYFACTNGGQRLKGQVFRYTPSPYEGTFDERRAPGRLELFIEANDSNLIENADNLTVAPWGDLILCEDSTQNDILGVTPYGHVYKFASNVMNTSEFAGACFSPDGTTLFVNIQNPGFTLAITGPWPR